MCWCRSVIPLFERWRQEYQGFGVRSYPKTLFPGKMKQNIYWRIAVLQWEYTSQSEANVYSKGCLGAKLIGFFDVFVFVWDRCRIKDVNLLLGLKTYQNPPFPGNFHPGKLSPRKPYIFPVQFNAASCSSRDSFLPVSFPTNLLYEVCCTVTLWYTLAPKCQDTSPFKALTLT